MQALNSTGYPRKILAATGVGMFFAFLFLTPLSAFATSNASTVTITLNATTYPSGATITVNGTVTPAPTVSGTNVAVAIVGPNGATADANQFTVATSTGAWSGTFTAGGPDYVADGNGTYTVTANYQGSTASATFTYGTAAPTTSQTGTTTTIITSIITTEITTVSQGGVTTTIVNNLPGTTVTSVVTSVTSTVVNSTTSVPDSTALAIGAVGVIIAIIAAVLAVLAMRKK
jgi:hypothetical protein